MQNNRIKYIETRIEEIKGVVPMEYVMDPYDTSILWFPIKGYNGYELCNLGFIRSVKNHNSYPFGTLLKFSKIKNDKYYILSDNNNTRRKVLLLEIQSIVSQDTSVYARFGYVVDYRQSRNSRKFIRFDYHDKSNIVKEARPVSKEKVFMPSFTIQKDEIIQPFIFL